MGQNNADTGRLKPLRKTACPSKEFNGNEISTLLDHSIFPSPRPKPTTYCSWPIPGGKGPSQPGSPFVAAEAGYSLRASSDCIWPSVYHVLDEQRHDPDRLQGIDNLVAVLVLMEQCRTVKELRVLVDRTVALLGNEAYASLHRTFVTMINPHATITAILTKMSFALTN